MPTPPLPSHGPRVGRNCDVTPVFSGVPRKGDKIRIITPIFSGAQNWAKLLHNPCVLGGSPEKETGMASIRPVRKCSKGRSLIKENRMGFLKDRLDIPNSRGHSMHCESLSPTQFVGQKGMSSWGVYDTLAFSGVSKARTEMATMEKSPEGWSVRALLNKTRKSLITAPVVCPQSRGERVSVCPLCCWQWQPSPSAIPKTAKILRVRQRGWGGGGGRVVHPDAQAPESRDAWGPRQSDAVDCWYKHNGLPGILTLFLVHVAVST